MKQSKQKIKCKCGNMISDMNYCPKCGQGNFGKRKIKVVGVVKTKQNLEEDYIESILLHFLQAQPNPERPKKEQTQMLNESIIKTKDEIKSFISQSLKQQRVEGYIGVSQWKEIGKKYKFYDFWIKREKQEILEKIENIVNKKFPRGERKWCIECAKRIKKDIKKLLLMDVKQSKGVVYSQ